MPTDSALFIMVLNIYATTPESKRIIRMLVAWKAKNRRRMRSIVRIIHLGI